jgi:threonine/homoserine/homoserine lactone efflux protein
MIEHLAGFLLISMLVIVTPGQDTLLTVRNTLFGGRRSGVATGLGVAAGQTVWVLATGVGLAALLRASEPAFAAVRLVGAGYLIFLGCRALLAAFGRDGHPTEASGDGPRRRVPPLAGFRQGVISNVGNPKMAVFFTSLLPQFIPHSHKLLPSVLALGLIFSSLTIVWLTGYAVVVARAGDLLRRRSIRRALDGLAGAALVAFGVRLATERD